MDEDRIRYIEYHRCNKERARDMRANQTMAEQILREILRKKRFGHLFLRQKMISSFILDFYCSKLLLGIEVDGSSHNKKEEYDLMRDTLLYKKKILVIRFTNKEAFHDIK